jgi:hypothetical protein
MQDEEIDDLAALAGYARTLADAVDAAIPGWVDRRVREVLAAQGLVLDADGDGALVEAAQAARADGMPRLRALLEADIDEQRTNPLAILRSLVGYPTAVLQASGAQPVPRDEFAARNFPDDPYDLSPASFADVDPSLHEPGLVWGAAKAHVHLRRHRPAP